MKNKILLLLLLSALPHAHALSQHGDWEVEGVVAKTGAWTSDKSRIYMFEVEFIKSDKCVPAVGYLSMVGKKLGAPIAQHAAKSNMAIEIDGKQWSGPTIANMYEWGVQLWYYASSALIEKIKSGRDIAVKVSSSDISGTSFSLSGSARAIAEAARNCSQ